MKRGFGVLLLSITGISSMLCQDTTYYDAKWDSVNEPEAVFYRIVTEQDSIWRIEDYYINDQMQMEGYLNSPSHLDRHGDFKWYDQDGNLAEAGSYVEGRRHGTIVWFYPNGQVKAYETYVNGQNEGAYLNYYENGNFRIKGSSKNGQLHGKIAYWHENGQRKTEGQFYYGKQDGRWIFLDSTGQVINEVLFHVNVEFEECGLTFEIPNDSWYLNERKTNSWYVWYEFKRKPILDPQGIPIIPNITFIIEDVPDNQDLVVFSAAKRGAYHFDVDSLFIHSDGDLKIKNAIGYTGSTIYEDGVEHTVYLIHAIHNNKGIQVIMDMTTNIFQKHGHEFDQAVRNINYKLFME